MKNKRLPVRRTKEPARHILRNMVSNLGLKYKCSIKVEISYWNFHSTSTYERNYRIWIGRERKQHRANSWNELIDLYYELIRKED